MDILKDKGYYAACKDLMNKVMKLFKIKGKKDKGYDSVRMASKREWKRYREQEKRTGNRRGNKREQRIEQVEEGEEMKKAKDDSHPISERAGNFSHHLN